MDEKERQKDLLMEVQFLRTMLRHARMQLFPQATIGQRVGQLDLQLSNAIRKCDEISAKIAVGMKANAADSELNDDSLTDE